MTEAYPEKQLSDQDIIRLGVEAGAKVLSMPDFPSTIQIEEATTELSMRATELAYRQQVTPDGVDS